MSSAVIRPARPEDEATVRALVCDAYSHYVARLGREPGPMADNYEARIAAGQVWVLYTPGVPELAGIVVLEARDRQFLLDNIAVAPACQGRGYGGVLMRFAEERAMTLGYDTVVLYTHVLMTENIALYKKLGFVETGRVSEKGFDRVYMAKSLTGAGT
jgi:ribosomal protein S18 acetylase RimI-like enzyme